MNPDKPSQQSTMIITGGAGFIGSHLSDFYLKKGCQVICVDNLSTGQKQNINHLISRPDFKFIEADVVQKSTLEKLDQLLKTLKGTKPKILHFASPAGPHPDSPLSYMQMPIKTYLVNSLGTHRLLNLAKKFKAEFLLASTSEVYGDPQQHPQKETYNGNVNVLGPRACYDESKRFGEMVTYTFSKRYQLEAKIVRIFNTFGPRMNPRDGRAIPLFINQALKNQPITIFGDGQQTRSFCYISDLVLGIDQALEKGRPGQAYNLGSPQERTIKKTVQTILKLTNSQSKVNHKPKLKDDPQKRCPDISKAKKALGWQPTESFKTGLKKTIGYFKNI